MDILRHAFGAPGDLTAWQECARAALVFAYGLAAVRLVGRRIFARWSALDIVVSIIVGSNLSRALTGNAPLWGTLAATTLLLALHWVMARAAARWAGFSALVEGRAVEVGRDGRIDARAARRSALSRTDLEEALHQAGLEEAISTRRMILEPSGKLSILRSGR